MLAKDYWREDEELLVYNIDTYVEPGLIKREDIVGDGFMPCFSGEGEHWSFAGVGEDGKVTRVTEKKRISNHCSIGLYYFKDCKLYMQAYRGFYGDVVRGSKDAEKEKYIAPIYNWLIEHGFEVRICDLPKDKVHCLGTPGEVEEFKVSCGVRDGF